MCGEAPEPGLVAVLDPLALRARRVRALFVCCLQEETFPAPARPRAFLSEEERRSLAEHGDLRMGEQLQAIAAERYLLYAAVSRPQERLYLSWHLTGDDGEPKTRSLFVDDVCEVDEAADARARASRTRRRRDRRPRSRGPTVGRRRRSAGACARPVADHRRAAGGRTGRAAMVGLLP